MTNVTSPSADYGDKHARLNVFRSEELPPADLRNAEMCERALKRIESSTHERAEKTIRISDR